MRQANETHPRKKTSLVPGSSAIVVTLMLAALCATQAPAQVPTATLGGRVGNRGQPLTEVTVTVKSPALQRSRSTTTGSTGDYTFVSLPPGEFTVTFALGGFSTKTHAVKLSASQVSRLDAVLDRTAVSAEAIVIGRTEAISQASTEATTVTGSLLAALPTSRQITEAVLLSAGVNNNAPNGISISGGQSIENLYSVNGVVVQDNVKGNLLN